MAIANHHKHSHSRLSYEKLMSSVTAHRNVAMQNYNPLQPDEMRSTVRSRNSVRFRTFILLSVAIRTCGGRRIAAGDPDLLDVIVKLAPDWSSIREKLVERICRDVRY